MLDLDEQQGTSDPHRLDHSSFVLCKHGEPRHPKEHHAGRGTCSSRVSSAKGIQGLVIDLRRDGGGSLEEAINLTGLFIPKGPVVQAKDSNGKITVSQDTNPDLAYSGPLIVLTNRAERFRERNLCRRAAGLRPSRNRW